MTVSWYFRIRDDHGINSSQSQFSVGMRFAQIRELHVAFRVLQLSDIHFSNKPDDERIEHADVREEVLNDLREKVIPNHGPIDAILIAGDIAFSGKRHEYLVAAAWLERVIEICGCKLTNILPVPGNHDVDRSRIAAATRMIHKRLRSCSLQEASKELTDLVETKDGTLTDKLLDYQAFAASYGCNFISTARPQWQRHFVLEGTLSLGFLGLTSVQVCDADDQQGGMLLGAGQYTIDRLPCVEQIVVMHHPIEWLKDRLKAHEYLHSRARVLIFGHEHYQSVVKITDNIGDRLVIGSGAVTPEHAMEPYTYRYNILEFAKTEIGGEPGLNVKVYPRVWLPEATRFEPDRTRLNGQDSATYELRCPQFALTLPPHAAGHDPGPSEDEAFSRLCHFYWRYLSWQERLSVLVGADALPDTERPVNVNMISERGLLRAQTEGRLNIVWDLTMQKVPLSRREVNPF